MAENQGKSIPLASQVGGHAGVMASSDGSLIIKPCLPAEKAFYETIVSGASEGFKLLLPHLPKFHGTVTQEPLEGEDKGKESLVLQNLSFGYTHPNILDVKLGTVLYDEHASEEKKQRMIKAARDTTSLETGVRITGFQVYDTTTEKSINTPKDYGRALKVAQLPEAAARFFPFLTPILSLSTPTPVEEGGHTDITPSPAGTDPKLLIPVLEGLVEQVKEIQEALSKTEFRMVGGSLLFIYEGDPVVLANALKSQSDQVVVPGAEVAQTTTLEEALAKSEEEGTKAKVVPAYSVKLIDFAHTKVESGLGPDEGVLLGVKTVIQLLEGRIKEAKEALGSV